MKTRNKNNFYSMMLKIAALVICYSTPAIAESMNYKFNTQLVRVDMVEDGEVDGHVVYLIYEDIIFESGELATIKAPATTAHINGVGPLILTVNMIFADGSMITKKRQGTIRTTPEGTGALCNWTSEILNGSGRFEGIKGNQIGRATSLKIHKGDLEGEMQGEGTINYTLPLK
jgi:hypothetical protein